MLPRFSFLTEETKNKIEAALLDMHNSPNWKEQLASFGVSCFRPTSVDNYLSTMDLLDSTRSLKIEETYY